MKRNLHILQRRHSISLLGVCWLVLIGTGESARADLGTLAVAAETQRYRISVLTLPTPLRVGPAVFNIAVRDLGSRQPPSDADVLLILTPPEDVPRHQAHHHDKHEIRVHAQQDQSRHPGFSSAVLDLSSTGSWNARVVVKTGGREDTLPFVLQVGPPSPPWLLGIKQRLLRRQHSQRRQ